MRNSGKFGNIFIALLIAASFAIAGCGGGGGTAAVEEPPMTGPTDAERIADAQTAAMTAAGVAAAALAAVEANQSADLDSYIRASIANDNAQAALEAASAATTPAAAEAAQADAEAAQADVQKYAGMVTNAHNALEAAKVELKALNDARAAAMKAYTAAKDALDAIAGQGDADSASYDMAMAALAAALVANDAAMDAETSAEAEAAKADAEDALADAMKYAGMVTSAHTEATALSAAQQAAMAAYTAAKDALAAAEADKDYDLASYTRAQDAVADAKAASDAAAAATTSEAAEAAQTEAEGYRDNAVKYADMVADAKVAADAEKAAEEQAAKDAEEAAKLVAANTKAALTKEQAIGNEASTTATDGVRPFDSDDDFNTVDEDANSATNYKFSVSHKDGSVMIGITDGALTKKNDPEFSQTGMLQGGYVSMRDNGNGESETIVTHTDIDPPKDVAIFKHYPLVDADETPAEGSREHVGMDTDLTTTALDTLVVLATDGKLVDSPSFPATPAEETATRTYKIDVAATTGVDEASKFAGTFDGAAGTFRCAGDVACSVAITSEGVKTLTGVWHFTPNPGATVSVQDADYLDYGFWVKKTVTGGATKYDAVQTFAHSSLATSTGLDAAEITGSATYEGSAAGVYVHKPKEISSENPTATAGTFTADVALTARFETGDDGATADRISGEVSNFMLSGEEEQEWKVMLGIAEFATDTGAIAAGSTTGVEGKAKGTAIAGGWDGQMHGAVKAGPGVSAGDVGKPTVVVGEFNANFANGSSAAGAFGARRK